MLNIRAKTLAVTVLLAFLIMFSTITITPLRTTSIKVKKTSTVNRSHIVDELDLYRDELTPSRGRAGLFSREGNLGPLTVPIYNRNRQVGNWTIMVYLDADNNLEVAGIDDFLEMAEVGSSQGVNIIALFDRIDGYDDSYDDWTGTKLFYIEENMTPTAANALADWGEANMGDPQTLVNFIAWGIQNYPAEHYLVVLWDHGGGISGVCWDDTNNSDNLNLFEIRNALEAIHTQLGVKIDILGFDACLMGLIEVAYQIRDYVDYVVFSEETEPGDGWPYNDILAPLIANPLMTPAEFARLIAERYIESYNGGSQGYDASVTQSAINITPIRLRVMAKLNRLSGELLRNYETYKAAIEYALQNAESFYYWEQKDLIHFLKLLYSQISDTQLRILINETINALNSSILYGGHLSDHPNAYGLSAFFSYNEDYSQIDISRHHQWDELVEKIAGYEPELWCYDVIFMGSDNDNDGYYDSSLYLGIDLDTINSKQIDMKIYANVSTGEIFITTVSGITITGATSDDMELIEIPAPSSPDNYTFRFEVYEAGTNNLIFQLYYYSDDDIIDLPLENLPGYPQVEIISPKPYSTIYDIVIVRVNATDEDGITAVKIQIHGTWYSMTYNSTSGYYEYELATYEYEEGTLDISVNATDTGGNSTVVKFYYVIDNIETSIVNPQHQNRIRGNITIRVNVTLHSNHLMVDSVKARFSNETFSGAWLILQYNVTSSLYEKTVNTTMYSDGSYELEVSVSTNQSTTENTSIRVIIDNIIGDILLVDDDDRASYEEYYIATLEALGFVRGIDFDVWDVFKNGSVTYDLLADYETVIWFTGDAYMNTLTTSDQQALATYLDQGGSLFISGQDIGFDIGNSSFYINYLKAYYIQDNVGIEEVSGVSGALFEGLNLLLYGSDSANNCNYPSQIAPTSDAELIFYYDGDPSIGAAVLYRGTYKLVYFAFPFEAINGTDNRQEVMRRILGFLYKDTNPPILQLLSPANNSYINLNTINVSWTGKDYESGIDHYEVKIDDGPWISVGLNTSHEFTDVAAGSHTIYIKAVDSAENVRVVHLIITVDTTPPIIIIESPENNTVFNTAKIKVTWNSSDDLSGVDHYEIKVDDSSWKNIGNVSSYTVKIYAIGDHTIYVRVYDRAGNYAETHVTIKIVDNKAPTITVKRPSNNSYFNTSSINLTWQGSDDLSGIDHYEVKIDEEDWINVGTQTKYTLSGLDEGRHTIFLKAVDKASNEIIVKIHIIVDLTPPTITDLQPANNTYINKTTVLIEWSGTDNLSGIEKYEIKIDYGNWTDIGSSTNYTITRLAQGTHRIAIKVYDKAGNFACVTIVIIVDTEAPIIEIAFPENGTKFDKHTIEVNWTAQDNFGIKEFQIYVDGELYDTLPAENNSICIRLQNGWHEIKVVAIDQAGNKAFDTIMVKIEVMEYTYIILGAVALIAIILVTIIARRKI